MPGCPSTALQPVSEDRDADFRLCLEDDILLAKEVHRAGEIERGCVRRIKQLMVQPEILEPRVVLVKLCHGKNLSNIVV